MSAPVFVLAEADARGAEPGDVLILTGAEGRHAVAVRRLTAGEPVELVDGAGVRVRAMVTEVRPPDVLLARVLDVEVEDPPRPRLVVVQALAKGDRGELAVELLTEVGADVVVPWAAARSVAVWRGDRAARGVARWRATAREAGKQARRARFAEVRDPAGTAEVVVLLAGAGPGAAYVLHEGADVALVAAAPGGPPDGDVVLVVGPEGGIAPEELAAFTAAGAVPVRLGRTVLRTSTAGAAAVVLLAALWGTWG